VKWLNLLFLLRKVREDIAVLERLFFLPLMPTYGIIMSEITISISLTMFPRELVKLLENDHEFVVRHLVEGIYNI